LTWPIDAKQDIGSSEPASGLKRGLHNHVVAATHGPDSGFDPGPFGARIRIDDHQSPRSESVQVLRFVLDPALLEQVAQRVVP
jgi:hypothetical protein